MPERDPDDISLAESIPRMRWGKREVLQWIKNDYPNAFIFFKHAIRDYDAGGCAIGKLWNFFAVTGGFRTFTDHAKKWNAELENLDEETRALIAKLDDLAKEGNAAVATRDIPKIKDIIARFETVVDSIHLG